MRRRRGTPPQHSGGGAQVFRDNNAEKGSDYEGPREAKGIVSHLKKQAGPATSLLADAAAVAAFTKFDDDKDSVGAGADTA